MSRDMGQPEPMAFIPLISMRQADAVGEGSKAQVMRACAGWAARNAITRTATNWKRRFIRRTKSTGDVWSSMCARSHDEARSLGARQRRRSGSRSSPSNGERTRIASRSGSWLFAPYLECGQKGQWSMGQSLQSSALTVEDCARAAMVRAAASETNATVRFMEFSLTLKHALRRAPSQQAWSCFRACTSGAV
jgi:hypothetical protein